MNCDWGGERPHPTRLRRATFSHFVGEGALRHRFDAITNLVKSKGHSFSHLWEKVASRSEVG